jgi:peptidoglycan hydrolase CwlO-like protein
VTAPSYEQLAALVAAQERIIAQLQARIAEQDAEIAELKRAAGRLLAQLLQAAVVRWAGQAGAEVAARPVGAPARRAARAGGAHPAAGRAAR